MNFEKEYNIVKKELEDLKLKLKEDKLKFNKRCNQYYRKNQTFAGKTKSEMSEEEINKIQRNIDKRKAYYTKKKEEKSN
tara:strand:- start:663 stop:899 length:237 start_codon:yes stop_codon:yes gene_type:complete